MRGRTDLPPRRKGRRRDERATTPHDGHGIGRDRIPPAGTPAEVGRLGSSLQRGAARAAERIVAVDSPLYAGIPGQTATRTAPAAAEDGPAPVGYHVDVLESLEQRVVPCSRRCAIAGGTWSAAFSRTGTAQTCCTGNRSITSTHTSPRRQRRSPCSPAHRSWASRNGTSPAAM